MPSGPPPRRRGERSGADAAPWGALRHAPGAGLESRSRGGGPRSLPRVGRFTGRGVMSSVLLFPGQGSQDAGMRDYVAEHRPDLLNLAMEVVEEDPFERAGDGTAYLQPALYCTSIAMLGRLLEPEADFYVGHSLGELTALVAAGSLSEEEGLRVVATRGRLMQRFADEAPEGAMLAVGAPPDVVADLASSLGLTLANDNSSRQVVLSGDAVAIAEARAEARRRGLRAFRLPIKGAFPSPALATILPEFRAALDSVTFERPQRPVLSCVTVSEFDDIPLRLAEALTHPVRWRELLIALYARGANRFVEVGPGHVLTKLVLNTLTDVEAVPAQELETACPA